METLYEFCPLFCLSTFSKAENLKNHCDWKNLVLLTSTYYLGIGMLKNKDKVFDDIARVAGGTVSVFSGVGQSIREDIRSYIDDVADRLDLVPREDFERLELQVAALQKKIDKLEKPSKKSKPKTASKTAKTTKSKK